MNLRHFVRVKASLRFTFSWSGPSPDDAFFELFRTIDVSAGGARVVRHVPDSPLPPIGAQGEFTFNIEQTEIRAQGTVVRHFEGGFVVRFRSLRRSAEDQLASWVFRQQAARRGGPQTRSG